MESGFTLTQIGEFSFIIASLGMGLGVLDSRIYPIIVAVSVLTIFTNSLFHQDGRRSVQHRGAPSPASLRFLIDRYSGQSYDTSETRRLWRAILRDISGESCSIRLSCWRRSCFRRLSSSLRPRSISGHGDISGVTVITVLAMLPFLMALCFSSTKESEKVQLHRSAAFYEVPLLAMKIIRYLVALFFIVYFTTVAYSSIAGWLVGVGCFILVLVFASTRLMKHYSRIERKFIDNLNMRENERLGKTIMLLTTSTRRL